jgi:hypothetical protein
VKTTLGPSGRHVHRTMPSCAVAHLPAHASLSDHLRAAICTTDHSIVHSVSGVQLCDEIMRCDRFGTRVLEIGTVDGSVQTEWCEALVHVCGSVTFIMYSSHNVTHNIYVRSRRDGDCTIPTRRRAISADSVHEVYEMAHIYGVNLNPH